MKTHSRSPFSEAFSRRDLLWGASSGLAVSLAGSALPAYSESPQTSASSSQGNMQAVPKRGITPASMPKAWSAEEYRRRWQNVRQGMKEKHFDCLLVPQHSTHTPAEFGGSIVVTEKGARRLGQHKMELMTLGA
jgi:hypothetical protein